MMVAESDDGLLFSTVQVYSPPVVTVRVCVYCAVSGSSSDSGSGVSGPSDSGSRSTSGDTGEGQLVRVKCNFISHYCSNTLTTLCLARTNGFHNINKPFEV